MQDHADAVQRIHVETRWGGHVSLRRNFLLFYRLGIDADLYTPIDTFFSTVEEEPKNKCYCPGDEYCPPKGLQNISPCQYSKYYLPIWSEWCCFVNEKFYWQPAECLHGESFENIKCAFALKIPLGIYALIRFKPISRKLEVGDEKVWRSFLW